MEPEKLIETLAVAERLKDATGTVIHPEAAGKVWRSIPGELR